MNTGLREVDLTYIKECISRFPEIDKAVIFGSRAKGNHQAGSDVDIAIFGDQVSFNTIGKLHALLEGEGPLPYFFDVVDYKTIENKDLKEHIDRVGILIYCKN